MIPRIAGSGCISRLLERLPPPEPSAPAQAEWPVPVAGAVDQTKFWLEANHGLRATISDKLDHPLGRSTAFRLREFLAIQPRNTAAGTKSLLSFKRIVYWPALCEQDRLTRRKIGNERQHLIRVERFGGTVELFRLASWKLK
jgi:hypothetical protein